MEISYKTLKYYMLCAILMFFPRRWFIVGIQSYRLVILLMLILECNHLKINKKIFNITTIIYLLYVSLYYLFDSGILSFVGFILDTAGIIMLVGKLIKGKEDLSCFLGVFGRCISIYSVLCIIQTLTELNIFDIIAGKKSGVAATSVYYRFGLVRSYGSFTTSINNALFLVISSCLILYMIDKSVTKLERQINIMRYILCVLAIVSSLSRMPILILLLTILLFSLRKGLLHTLHKNAGKCIISIIVITIVLLSSVTIRNAVNSFNSMFLAVFDNSVSDSITNSFGVNANGVGDRLRLYEWVGEEIREKKLIGVGPNKDIQFTYTDKWNKTRIKTSIENQYLKIVRDFGYIGLAIYVLFSLKILYFTYRKIKHNRIISFHYTSFIIQMAYLICIFSVASVDDMRIYLTIIALTYGIKNREIEIWN